MKKKLIRSKKKKILIDEEKLIKLLQEISPKITKDIINSKNLNLVNDGYLDSFDIIQIIAQIEKIIKKKINPSKLNRNSFKNLKSILRLFV